MTYDDGQPTPGAVHGKYVPGLPWDTLPRPQWISDAPMNELEEQIERLADEMDQHYERAEELQEEADAERTEGEKLHDQIAPLIAELEAADGTRAAKIKRDIGW